jgi:hypothetical protein
MDGVRLNYWKNSLFTNSVRCKKVIKIYDNGDIKRVQVTSSLEDCNIIIQYDSCWKGTVRIRIFNLIGYDVCDTSYSLLPGINKYIIECASLKEGTYIVETDIWDFKEGLIATFNKIELSNKARFSNKINPQ